MASEIDDNSFLGQLSQDNDKSSRDSKDLSIDFEDDLPTPKP